MTQPTFATNRAYSRFISVASNNQRNHMLPRFLLFIALFLTPLAATASDISKAERAELQAISAHFNTISTLQGRFLQFGPRGEQSEGSFSLKRPGRVLFDYDPPMALQVVSNGEQLLVADGKRNTNDLYSLKRSPLRFLLDDKLDLSKDKKVQDVSVEGGLITVRVSSRAGLKNNKIAFMFDKQSKKLVQWIVTDAQGLDTSVTIFDTSLNESIDDNLFYIDVKGLRTAAGKRNIRTNN